MRKEDDWVVKLERRYIQCSIGVPTTGWRGSGVTTDGDNHCSINAIKTNKHNRPIYDIVLLGASTGEHRIVRRPYQKEQR